MKQISNRIWLVLLAGSISASISMVIIANNYKETAFSMASPRAVNYHSFGSNQTGQYNTGTSQISNHNTINTKDNNQKYNNSTTTSNQTANHNRHATTSQKTTQEIKNNADTPDNNTPATITKIKQSPNIPLIAYAEPTSNHKSILLKDAPPNSILKPIEQCYDTTFLERYNIDISEQIKQAKKTALCTQRIYNQMVLVERQKSVDRSLKEINMKISWTKGALKLIKELKTADEFNENIGITVKGVFGITPIEFVSFQARCIASPVIDSNDKTNRSEIFSRASAGYIQHIKQREFLISTDDQLKRVYENMHKSIDIYNEYNSGLWGKAKLFVGYLVGVVEKKLKNSYKVLADDLVIISRFTPMDKEYVNSVSAKMSTKLMHSSVNAYIRKFKGNPLIYTGVTYLDGNKIKDLDGALTTKQFYDELLPKAEEMAMNRLSELQKYKNYFERLQTIFKLFLTHYESLPNCNT